MTAHVEQVQYTVQHTIIQAAADDLRSSTNPNNDGSIWQNSSTSNKQTDMRRMMARNNESNSEVQDELFCGINNINKHDL
jgi:hypothetical protein